MQGYRPTHKAAGSPANAPETPELNRRSDLTRSVDGYSAQQAALAPPDMVVQCHGGGQGDPAAVRSAAASGMQGAGSAYPHLAAIQQSVGPNHNLGGAKAHIGGAAADACGDIGAKAYASNGAAAFKSTPDLWTAAHEATHLIQQRDGVSLLGGVGREGDTYEQQADAVADRVVAGRSATDLLPGKSEVSGGNSAVQCYVEDTINGSDAKAADDKSTVLVDAQELYTTSTNISEGNAKLKGAGKDGSFIELAEGKGEMEYHGQKLKEVVPKWNSKGANDSYHKKVSGVNKPGGKDTDGISGGPMAVWTDCGRSAAAVTGSKGGGDREAVYKDGGKEQTATGMTDSSVTVYKNATPNKMASEIYMKLLPDFLKDKANAGYLKANTHYTGSGGKKVVKAPKDIAEAKEMYWELGTAGRDAFDKAAGTNHYANPEIGEAYSMATEAQMPGFKKQSKKTWNYHWAGVIMKAGSDNITLENYAVTSDTAKAAGVKRGEYVDRDWNFDLYGTKNKKQTFHKAHLDSKTHGNRATSMRVRTTK